MAVVQMLEGASLTNEDSWMESTTETSQWASQNLLSDFIDFLNNLVRARIKNINQAILPQIVTHLVRLVSLKFDSQALCYPVNLQM